MSSKETKRSSISQRLPTLPPRYTCHKTDKKHKENKPANGKVNVARSPLAGYAEKTKWHETSEQKDSNDCIFLQWPNTFHGGTAWKHTRCGGRKPFSIFPD